jgi:hypothetical protein
MLPISYFCTQSVEGLCINISIQNWFPIAMLLPMASCSLHACARPMQERISCICFPFASTDGGGSGEIYVDH